MSKYEIYIDPGGLLSGARIVVAIPRRVLKLFPKKVAQFRYNFWLEGDAKRALAEAEKWIAQQEDR